jgi:CheY-like chemotaxis protein
MHGRTPDLRPRHPTMTSWRRFTPEARPVGGEDRDVGLTTKTESQPPDDRSTLNGMRILVVDDDLDTRDIMDVALEAFGARVTTAESVTEAYTCLGAAAPDVVICDLAMPGHDGLSFVRKIRSMERFRGTPILAVTARGDEFGMRELRAAGFTALLRKPFDPPQLARAVAALARGRGSRPG